MVRVVSVALLLVAMFSGSASAECAWVLWYEESRINLPGDGQLSSASMWKVVSATGTEAECRRGLIAEAENRSGSSPHRTVKPIERGVLEEVFHVAADGTRRLVSTATIVYVCLPDTVDPRGPKGR